MGPRRGAASTRWRPAAPTRRICPMCVSALPANRRRARRSAVRRRYVIVAVPSHGLRAVVRAAAPHIPSRRGARERHEGPRDRHAAADVGSDRRRNRRTASRRRAVGSELCRRKSRGSCRRRSSPRRPMRRPCASVQEEFRGPTLPPLRIRRRRRRRGRRGAEEHHCDRGRRRSSRCISATTRWRRSSRAASPRFRGWPARWAGGARRWPA